MTGAVDTAASKVGEIRCICLERPQELVASLAGELSAAELARAARFHFARDRRRFIVARGELRRILAAELGVSAGSIAFDYGAYGKPMLAPPFDSAGVRFNLAHSAELAVVALCCNRDVGIDVEEVRLMHDEAQLVCSNFSPRERQEYLQVKVIDRTNAFFNGWTRKEAFIKGLGKGLSQPLDSFDVSLAPQEPAQLRRFGSLLGVECGWCLASFIPAPGYVAAVAMMGEQINVI